MKGVMVHQNAVKAQTAISLGLTCTGTEERDCLLICSGGDDNAVAFTIMTFPRGRAVSATGEATDARETEENNEEVRCQTTVVKDAHAAAVTGIVRVPTRLSPLTSEEPSAETVGTRKGESRKVVRVATAGNDQRLKTWWVEVTGDGTGVEVEVQREADVPSTIADAGALAVARDAAYEYDCEESPRGSEEGDAAWKGRVVVTGVGVEVWDCCASSRGLSRPTGATSGS